MKLQITFLLLLLSLCTAAQPKQGQARLDSLLTEVPKMKEDTNGFKLLHRISAEYRHVDPDLSIQYAQKSLDLAQKIAWPKGEATGNSDLGGAYITKADFPRALDYLFKSLSVAERIDYKPGIIVASLSIGNVYQNQINYEKALAYHTKARRIADETGDTKLLAAAVSNIASIYMAQHKYNEALEHYQKSLQLSEKVNNKTNILREIGNIGLVYAALKNYPAALAYTYKSLAMSQELNDKQTIAFNFGNIGVMHLDIAKDTAYIRPDSLVPAGKAANIAKAITYLNKGIALCYELHLDDGTLEFTPALSEAYVLSGDYKAALDAYKQYTVIKDTLYNTENNEKISNLETKRAVELKDKDIQIAKLAVAKKRNERVFFIAGIALLLGIMGILFRSFRRQQRSNILLSKEKKRSDDLLLNILPAEVAEELKESGGAQARQFDEVSVLFTDFVNFTGSSEQLGAQVMVKELNECFTAFDGIIERNGLEKIKTIGDAYMAVCGLPASDPLHAKKTVRAAIEIRDFIEERKKRERAFDIRIGINSGSVVAGIIGVKKFAYDIWGDTVNTAARMEQHGEAGAINISQSTYELVKDDFRCDYRGKLAAKNKGEIEMYFVEAAVGVIV